MDRFGRAWLSEWRLDSDIVYLNHGTVGAPPRRVLLAQRRIQNEIERQPSQGVLRDCYGFVGTPPPPARVRAAAREVAAFFGCAEDDLVFVDNASTGVNAVLRSLPFSPGDEIVIHDFAYGAVTKCAEFVAHERGVKLSIVEIPGPPFHEDAIVAAYEKAITPRTRLVITDHVASDSALIFPVRRLAEMAHAKNVPIFVDGAHAPGMLELSIPEIGADFYTGNLHKWAHAPRSAGILWVAREHQARLHPPVISWGYGAGFTAEFDHQGTRDASALLAAPEGLAFLRELGPEARRRNHALAWAAAERLSRSWGTELAAPQSMVGSMALVQLPERAGSSREDAARLRDALLFEDGIEVSVPVIRGRMWVRISIQIYNDDDDVTALERAMARRLQVTSRASTISAT